MPGTTQAFGPGGRCHACHRLTGSDGMGLWACKSRGCRQVAPSDRTACHAAFPPIFDLPPPLPQPWTLSSLRQVLLFENTDLTAPVKRPRETLNANCPQAHSHRGQGIRDFNTERVKHCLPFFLGRLQGSHWSHFGEVTGAPPIAKVATLS